MHIRTLEGWDGVRVPSSQLLNHNRIRVNINVSGHVCQAVNTGAKHTQMQERMCGDKCSSHHSALLPGMRNLKGNVCSPCFRVPVQDTERHRDNHPSVETVTITLLFPQRRTCLRAPCSILSGKQEQTYSLRVFTLQLFRADYFYCPLFQD